MIEAPHYTPAGAKREAGFGLPEDTFDGTVNEPVLHQAVKVFLNNQRQGTAKTKTRSFVSGGNQKPWKQKGTGRARQGSTRAPHWRGGGIVFGPIPRDYRTDIPRKVKQLARKSALNARAREGALHVVEQFAFRTPKTARLSALLASLGLTDRKVLVLSAGTNEALYLSGRNLPTVDVMPYAQASAYDVLWAEAVVVEEGAFTGETRELGAEELPGLPERAARNGQAGEAKAPKAARKSAKAAAPKAAKKSAKAAKAAKKSTAKTAKKSAKAAKAAKKSPAKGAKKAAPKKKGNK
ncbi:MAG TPA: 50S ribosomal protein L4 [Gemmatimonadales bacterium]|jgi:large subunit ribosomal protein L4|nr:50S ribosomal protein L4 [Gemmatimonadales bacterium]